LKVGQKVIHKSIMQEGTVLSVGNKVAKVVFDDGEVRNVHHELLAEMIDGNQDDNRQFLTE